MQKLPADNKHDHAMTSHNWQPFCNSSDSELLYLWDTHGERRMHVILIKKVESCSLDMPEDVTWYSGSLSNLCRECPD